MSSSKPSTASQPARLDVHLHVLVEGTPFAGTASPDVTSAITAAVGPIHQSLAADYPVLQSGFSLETHLSLYSEKALDPAVLTALSRNGRHLVRVGPSEKLIGMLTEDLSALYEEEASQSSPVFCSPVVVTQDAGVVKELSTLKRCTSNTHRILPFVMAPAGFEMPAQIADNGVRLIPSRCLFGESEGSASASGHHKSGSTTTTVSAASSASGGGSGAAEVTELQPKIARALLRRVPGCKARVAELATLHIMFRRMPLPATITDRLSEEARALAERCPTMFRYFFDTDDEGLSSDYLELLTGTGETPLPASAFRWRLSGTTVKHVHSVLAEAGPQGLPVMAVLEKYRAAHHHDLVTSPLGGARATLQEVPNVLVWSEGEVWMAALDESYDVPSDVSDEIRDDARSQSSRSDSKDTELTLPLSPRGNEPYSPAPSPPSSASSLRRDSWLSDRTLDADLVTFSNSNAALLDDASILRPRASEVLTPQVLHSLLVKCPNGRAFVDEISTLHYMFRRQPLERRPFKTVRSLLRHLTEEHNTLFKLETLPDIDGASAEYIALVAPPAMGEMEWHVAPQVESKLRQLLLTAGINGIPLSRLRSTFMARYGGQAMVVSPWGGTSAMLRRVPHTAALQRSNGQLIVVHAAFRGGAVGVPCWDEMTFLPAPQAKPISMTERMEYIEWLSQLIDAVMYDSRSREVELVKVIDKAETRAGRGCANGLLRMNLWDVVSCLRRFALQATPDGNLVLRSVLSLPAVAQQYRMSPQQVLYLVQLLDEELSKVLPSRASDHAGLGVSEVLAFVRRIPELEALGPMVNLWDFLHLSNVASLEYAPSAGALQAVVRRRYNLNAEADAKRRECFPMGSKAAVASFHGTAAGDEAPPGFQGFPGIASFQQQPPLPPTSLAPPSHHGPFTSPSMGVPQPQPPAGISASSGMEMSAADLLSALLSPAPSKPLPYGITGFEGEPSLGLPDLAAFHKDPSTALGW